MGIAGDAGIRVPAPACETRPYGLETAAEVDERGDNEWLKGLEFDEELCPSGAPALSGQCPPLIDGMQHKSSHRGFDVGYADPFVLYQGWDCSTGGLPLSAAWDHAEALLARSWRRGLEHAFWTGLDQDGNPIRMSLGGGDVVDLSPTGKVGVLAGLALLEEYMAQFSDCAATIHASSVMGPYLASKALMKTDGDSLRTPNGSRLVLGGGYDRSGPGGSAPTAGSAWMYASGGVRITTGPMFFTPDKGDLAGAVDRTINDIEVFAEKAFAIQIACGLVAVEVELGGNGLDSIDGEGV